MSEIYAAHRKLCNQLFGILRNKDPVTQGSALAEALALWIAGHDPAIREEVLANSFQAVRELIPVMAPKLDQARSMVEALLNQAGTKQ